jgi:hypothetical protein
MVKYGQKPDESERKALMKGTPMRVWSMEGLEMMKIYKYPMQSCSWTEAANTEP